MPKKAALLIGVSEYGQDIPSLSAPPHDVAALKKVLEHPKMGRFDEVETLVNPDLIALQTAVQRLFSGLDKQDLGLLFFSGHGITDDNNKLYLATKGTAKDLYEATSVPASFVQSQSKKSYAKRQIIILDCCYSGAFAEGWQAKSVGLNLQKELGAEGRVVLTSSTATQTSFQQEDAKLSLYTQYLVEGIETGAADKDGDGKIYAQELHNYAKTKVKEVKPKMEPGIISDREGFNILISLAPVNDPELEFRKLVERYVRKGQISTYRREFLQTKQREFSLTDEKAEEIINSVLEPFRRHSANLQRYREAYQEEVSQRYPLDEALAEDLQDWGREVLGLKEKDLAQIQQQVSTEKEADYQRQLEAQRQVAERQRQEEAERLRKREEEERRLKQQQEAQRQKQAKKTQSFDFEVVTVNRKGKEINRSSSRAEFFAEDLGNGVILEMVAIPGGKFMMGTEDAEIERLCQEYDTEWFKREKPQHQVTIQPFFMAKYPITQAQWKAVAALAKVKRDLKPDLAHFKGDNRPVEQVSWYDAVEFCQRLAQKTGRDYRLPSEAEWEYACRAIYPHLAPPSEGGELEAPLSKGGLGGYPPFYFGETITTDLANYNGNYTYADAPKGEYRRETTPVGQFPPNAFGLYDMHGQVWEWCLDHWHDNYNGAPTDGSAWLSENYGRLLRGGCWDHDPYLCRSASRYHLNPGLRGSYIGLRVACAAPRTL